MREFLIRRLRRVPVIEGLWDEYERMLAARDKALAERDAAREDRMTALAERAAWADCNVQERQAGTPRDPYPTPLYVMWAYRLLLGREPEDPEAVEYYAEKSRSELVEIFINSPEFQIKNVLDHIRPSQRRYMVEHDNGFRFWLMYGDEFVSPAMAAAVYEPAETNFVKRHVRAGMAVVDVGANLGWFTVHLADLVGKGGSVDAFEPRSDLFHLLGKTTAENHLTNITLHNCALGSQNSNGQMIWSLHDSNPGGTNLVPADFTSPEVKSEPIAVRTLDSCLSHHIDFIKMDVEGSEPAVIAGAERILAEDRPTMLVEINPSNLLRTSGTSTEEFGCLVEKLHYRLYEILADGNCGKEIKRAELSALETIVNVAMVPEERAE